MNRMMQLRQGDVFLEEVSTLPKDAIRQTAGRSLLLAEGEATGHAHVLEIGDSELDQPAELWRSGDEEFVVTEAPGVIRHEEHETVPVEKKIYRLRKPREYTAREARRVQD